MGGAWIGVWNFVICYLRGGGGLLFYNFFLGRGVGVVFFGIHRGQILLSFFFTFFLTFFKT